VKRFLVVLVAAAAIVGVERTSAATVALRWSAAPSSGQRLVVTAGKPFSLQVKAVASDRKQRIRLSLLGSTPMRLVATPGNPAAGTVSYAVGGANAHDFSVTLVARAEPSGLAITRTFVVVFHHGAVSLVGPGTKHRWAYVLASTVARSSPSSSARPVGKVATATSDGRPNLVLLLARQTDVLGHPWVRARLTSLPNGLTGWIPERTLSNFRVVDTMLVVDTKRLTLQLFRQGKVAFRAPVGVGKAAWPTPKGSFYVREKVTGFHNPFYGPIAFGTSARSEVLTDWPGGGVVGIHGTNAPSLIPGRISHGCIRMRNEDIVKLARLLPLGTPLIVR
jgi:hypothetical protein